MPFVLEQLMEQTAPEGAEGRDEISGFLEDHGEARLLDPREIENPEKWMWRTQAGHMSLLGTARCLLLW